MEKYLFAIILSTLGITPVFSQSPVAKDLRNPVAVIEKESKALNNGLLIYPSSNNKTEAIPGTFKFDLIGNFTATGTYVGLLGAAPLSGVGTRLCWMPGRAALRFGTATTNVWDSSFIGINSFAGGTDSKASNNGSFAYGDQVSVTSVLGAAFGSTHIVTGTAGFATGVANEVTGFSAIAMGFTNRANSTGSVAIGYRCAATDEYSVALGYRATSNGYAGGIVLGGYDGTTDSVLNTADAQFAARYTGGYRLYTKSDKTLGVSLAHNGTAWVSISDSTKKEKFVKADPSTFLEKLAKLKLGSWNYKGTDVDDRHYGPMAQEIFFAFGKDKLGKIGCDTTLSTLDMDGIMMIMLQGLEKRTADQTIINKKLSAELESATLRVSTISANLLLLKKENLDLKGQLAKMEVMQNEILALQKNVEKIKTGNKEQVQVALVETK